MLDFAHRRASDQPEVTTGFAINAVSFQHRQISRRHQDQGGDHSLLRIRRSPGGTRAHGEQLSGVFARTLARLSFIRRARSLGFSLDQVKALLRLSDQRDRSCSAVDLIAREHLADIDRKLADLTTLRAEIDSLIVQCGHGMISECRIIESLGPNMSEDDPDDD